MNPLVTNGIGMVLVVALLVGTGFHFGSQSATKEYLPQLEVLKAVIELSDKIAYETGIEQEKNHDEIAKSHSDNVASVISFYDRMLREARDKASTNPPTEHTGQSDVPACEPRACEPDIEFSRACSLDAIQILSFQDWIVANRIPVE